MKRVDEFVFIRSDHINLKALNTIAQPIQEIMLLVGGWLIFISKQFLKLKLISPPSHQIDT